MFTQIGQQSISSFSNNSNALTPSDPKTRPCSETKVLDRARVLIGCYRTGDAADPEVYVTALAAVLGSYPESVVMAVTDPRTGLPGRVKWLPTIYEVREACEIAHRVVSQQRERDENLKRQVAERDAYEAAIAAVSPERRREVIAEWRRNVRARLDEAKPDDVLDARPEQSAADRQRAASYHNDRVADLAARYAASPPPILSEAARRACGMAPAAKTGEMGQ